MSRGYLLDTNVLLEPLKPAPSTELIARLEAHTEKLHTAAPVLHEMCFVAQRLPVGKKRRAIERYINRVVRGTIEVLPYDESAAELHAAQRALLCARGTPPSFVDGQIAAIALSHQLTVVTANVCDFEHFEELQVENWMV